jgi:hypothetical protein
MRPRQLLALVLVAGLATAAGAQEVDRYADGLVPGAYLRIGGGTMAPVNAKGTLRDWRPGTGVSVAWESWDANEGTFGLSRLGFAIAGAYSVLRLDDSRFLTEFVPPSGGSVSSVSGSAGVLEVTTNLRYRIPAPYIMPSIVLGLGFIDWRPGQIKYSGSAGSGTTRQQHRSGAELAIGGTLDKTIVNRYAVFGEAMYVYGYTQFGGGYGTPTGVCAASGCDALRNTTVTTVRAGMRIRVMR